MPTRKSRLSRAELSEHKATCLKLEKLGIEAKCEETREPKATRFTLQQIYVEFARVYDLPDGSVVVTLPAKLTVLSSGLMFTEAAVFPEWDESPLDLEDAREHHYFRKLIEDFPYFPPRILNDLLVGRSLPLRRCQPEGLIIATGWSPVPAEYPDEKPARFNFCLRDEQGGEFSVEFVARVDRSLKRKYQRQRPGPRVVAERLAKRVPLFEREGAEPAVPQEVPGQVRWEVGKPSAPETKYRETI